LFECSNQAQNDLPSNRRHIIAPVIENGIVISAINNIPQRLILDANNCQNIKLTVEPTSECRNGKFFVSFATKNPLRNGVINQIITSQNNPFIKKHTYMIGIA
jgi:hypothetical protein